MINSTAATPGSSIRNTLTLSCLQALGGTNPAIVVSLAGLAGQQLASNPELATLPVSLYNLGLAVGTIPAALIMKSIGRRGGYLVGALFGIAAGLTSAFGIYSSAFLILCLGTICSGLYASYVQSYRFAAADGAPPASRPRAISWVLAGGLLGAVIATQAIIHTRDIWPDTPYAASFLAQAGLALLAIPFVLALRRSTTAKAQEPGQQGRPLSEIARTARFRVAVLSGVVTYGLMSFIMTATPLAMIGCGHSLQESTLGIQWHILAMYGPSFFTGSLIQRLGKIPVTIAGVLLIGAAAAIALTGLSVAHFWLALIFLGVGWNFGFIGATALVTDCYRPEEKTRVQALNDFLVFGCVAVASFSSGQVMARHGWHTLNLLVYPAIGLVLISLLWLWRHDYRHGAVTADTQA